MEQKHNYYIVRADVLPEVCLKVAEATRLLETGEVQTINEAAVRTGISRSAYYKYHDAVRPIQDMLAGRILTFQMTLCDIAGLLSSILTIFARNGANILTINQTIPIGGHAAVTISAETSAMTASVEDLLSAVRGTSGVVRAELLAG